MKRVEIVKSQWTSDKFAEVGYVTAECRYPNGGLLGRQFDVIKENEDGYILFKDSEGYFRTSCPGAYVVVGEWRDALRSHRIISDDSVV